MPTAPFLDAAAAAAQLGITRATLYAYVSRGLVQTRPDPRDPRRRVYSADDIGRLAANKSRGRKPAEIAATTLDWGLPALTSRITLIADGGLYYRGMDAAELAQHASLEDTARLLWNCGTDDPFAAAAPAVTPAWDRVGAELADALPIERCLALLPLAQAGTHVMWQHVPRRLWADGAALLRAMAAAATGTNPSTAAIHAHMAEAWRLDRRGAELLRAALVLCADHELNASAFAVRVIASTGASLSACLTGGLGALSGPLHGGMTSLTEILFEEADRAGDAASVVQERLRRGDRLPGFGHPLYPDWDPRARTLLALLPPDPVREALLAAMESIGGKAPNVDFALAAVRRALGLPRGGALALFAVGRTAGWIAHALEQQADGRLIRPRARYAGVPPPQPAGASMKGV
jgi:citrate synthase